jgi:hypothetical protein
MHAAPASCSPRRRLVLDQRAKRTEQTGCRVSRIELTTAGSRGSDVDISSQPITCAERASTISQPVAAHDGVRSRSPTTAPIAAQPSADASVATKRGRPVGAGRGCPRAARAGSPTRDPKRLFGASSGRVERRYASPRSPRARAACSGCRVPLRPELGAWPRELRVSPAQARTPWAGIRADDSVTRRRRTGAGE